MIVSNELWDLRLRLSLPPNVANEPRAALPGSHRSSGASAPFACYASELVVGNPGHKHRARSTDAN